MHVKSNSMRKKIARLLVAALCLLSYNVFANNSFPDTGVWWDPDASGRGYIIEQQEGTMFIISFHYAEDGQTQWMTSQGSFVSSQSEGTMGTYEGTVFEHYDGQCLTCAYTPPVTSESDQGPLTITFSDYRNALLEWEGESIEISKNIYQWSDINEELAGDWLLISVENGEQLSQMVTISDTVSGEYAEVRDANSDELVGNVVLLNGDAVLTLEQASETELPIVQPGFERFYAGYGSSDALQIVAMRLDDMPLVGATISAGIPGTTIGVLCDYNDSTPNNQPSLTITSVSSWTCTETSRVLSANGIPDHSVGTFPSAANPNTISEQNVSASFTLTPTESGFSQELGGPRGVIGYVLNGVKIDAGTAGTCNDTGSNCSLAGMVGNWSIEALGQTSFDFGDDENHAHVQPDGAYHYHGLPEGFISKLGGSSSTMTLIAWAADGFPIYARYGYSAAEDAGSGLKNMTGSYQLVTTVSDSRPSTSTYPLGTFTQDWVYVAGSGDLDECNGRYGVTPEFPEGIYHYYATDTYPYFQRCVKGSL